MPSVISPTSVPAWLRADPAVWPLGTLDRQALQADADALTRTAGFMVLAQAVAREMLAFLERSATAKRVVRDMPMYLLLVCCMHLQHRREPADPRSGITLANLRLLYSRGGTRRYASDTHLRDMLAWARQRGLLQRAATADGRVRRLEPTGLMVGMFQQWLQVFTRVGAMHLPPSLLDHQGLPCGGLAYEVLSYRISAYRVDGFVLTERHPLIHALMQRRHGYHLFLALLADMPADAPPGLSLPLSLSGLAQRFEISRGTVRNTLALAENAGLLHYDGGREAVRWLPGFADLARPWMALEIAWMAGLCRAASARLISML